MTKIKTILLLTICAAQIALPMRAENQNGSIVFFRSGDATVRGYLYKPEGAGPYPVIVYLPSVRKPLSESSPPLPDLGKFFNNHGYVFFIPYGRSLAELSGEE